MKWIGQHIYDQISRFRSDVYLEDISSGTIASGGNLGLDSNNKIVKATEATGDITSVSFTTGDDTTVTRASGNASFTIIGAAGISTSSAGTTVTITADAASTGGKGVVELASTAETATGTDTTRVVTPDGLKDGYQGSANVTTLGTIGTGTWQGTAIAHAYIGTDAIETDNIADAQVTVAKLHADAIQTSGESFADNDTSLMTSAAIDDKINTKYAYSYMTWSASAKPARDGSNNPEWMVPNTAKGIYEEDWNLDTNITSTTTGTTTYGFSRYTAANSLIIPHAGVLVGFHAIGRNDDSDLTFKAGLFHADNGSGSAGADGSAGEGIDYGAITATNEYTLRCVATAVETEASGGTDGTTNHSFKGPCKLISNTANLTVQAGDALMPAIMGNSSNSTDEIFVTMTIILKIPLTT